MGKALLYLPDMGLSPIGMSDIGLIPDLLDGIGAKFGVAAEEREVVIYGLGNEESILLRDASRTKGSR